MSTHNTTLCQAAYLATKNGEEQLFAPLPLIGGGNNMQTKCFNDTDIKILRARVRSDLSCESIFKNAVGLSNKDNRNSNLRSKTPHSAEIFVFPTPAVRTHRQAYILAN